MAAQRLESLEESSWLERWTIEGEECPPLSVLALASFGFDCVELSCGCSLQTFFTLNRFAIRSTYLEMEISSGYESPPFSSLLARRSPIPPRTSIQTSRRKGIQPRGSAR